MFFQWPTKPHILWPMIASLTFSSPFLLLRPLHSSCAGPFAISLAHWYTPTSLGESSGASPRYLQGSPPHFLRLHSHAVISKRPSLTTIFKIANYLPYSLSPYFLRLLYTAFYLLIFYIIYLFVPFKISLFPLLTEM